MKPCLTKGGVLNKVQVRYTIARGDTLMDTHRRNIAHAAAVGAQIEEILRRHGIRTTQRNVSLAGGQFAACFEAQRGNVALEWSIGHDGEDGSADYLAILLRIDQPEDLGQTLQQFKLLLVLSTRTWHSSAAGQLGFALDTQPDLDEELAMATVDKMARWFSDPQRRLPMLTPTPDE